MTVTRISPTLVVQLIEDVGVVLINEFYAEEVVIPLGLCDTVAAEISRLAQADAEHADHRAALRGETPQ